MANVVSVERLNEHTRVDQLDDGTQVIALQRGQNYLDRDTGAYQACDSNIYPDGTIPGFTHNTKAGSARTRLAPGGRFRFGLRHPLYVTYMPRGAAAVAPVVAGNRARFAGLWPSVDVELTKFPEGTKEDIILLDAAAPSSFVWDLEEIAGVVPTPAADGGLDYVETLTGEMVGRIPAPTVHDSAGVEGSAILTYGAGAVTIAVDAAWLADPVRTFPVTVDPTTVIQPDATAGIDAWINSGASYVNINYGTATGLRIGSNSAAGTWAHDLLQFSIPAIPSGATVSVGRLELYLVTGPSADSVAIYGITASWSESTVTWSNQPTKDASATVGATAIGAANAWYQFDIKALVEAWGKGTRTNYGLYVWSTTNSSWAEFASSDYATDATKRPKLTITYNSAPTATAVSPAGTQAAPGNVSNDLTPTLSWTYSDPDSDAQHSYQVQVYDAAGNPIVDTGTVNSAATSYAIPASAGLKYGSTYWWRAKVYDGIAWSAYTTAQYFRPTVAAPTGLTATADAADARINLACAASPAENLAGYRWYRRKTGGSSWMLLNQALTASPSYADDAVARGQSYDYQVTAVATDGYESPASAVAGNASVTWTAGEWWLGALNLGDKVYDCQPDYGWKTNVQERAGTRFPAVQSGGPSGRRLSVGARLDSEAELDALVAECSKAGPLSLRDPLGRIWRVKVSGDIRLAQLAGSSVHYNAVLRLTEVA